MNPYYTHQPYLINILEKFNYDEKLTFLEFGSGEGSSPIFNKYAQNKNVTIKSFEHDIDWLNEMKTKYSLPNYIFNQVDWDNFDYSELKSNKYDLIFVDQGDWDARIKTIDELKDNSKYVILHDYCYYNGFRGSEIPPGDEKWALSIDENSFFYDKYSNDFEIMAENTLFPPTLILKNKKL